MKQIIKTVTWLTAFSIAMGFLETAVVVYLRELMYDGGFSFPVQMPGRHLLITELWRELATLIMLLGVGVMAGKTFAQRFVFFLYSFAVWDIFYYVFLKVLLNWPATLFDWDILFLLPVPWVGPVLAPCLISFTMILLMLLVLYLETKTEKVRLDGWVWLGFVSGSLVLVWSFCVDYVALIRNNTDLSETDMLHLMQSFVPQVYHWGIFWMGEFLIMCSMLRLYFVHALKERLTNEIVKV